MVMQDRAMEIVAGSHFLTQKLSSKMCDSFALELILFDCAAYVSRRIGCQV